MKVQVGKKIIKRRVIFQKLAFPGKILNKLNLFNSTAAADFCLSSPRAKVVHNLQINFLATWSAASTILYSLMFANNLEYFCAYRDFMRTLHV